MSFIRTCLSFFSIFRGSLAWPGAIGIRTSTRRTGKELFRSCAFNESRRARRGSSFLLSLDTFVFFVKTGLSELLFQKMFNERGWPKKIFFPGPCGLFWDKKPENQTKISDCSTRRLCGGIQRMRDVKGTGTAPRCPARVAFGNDSWFLPQTKSPQNHM